MRTKIALIVLGIMGYGLIALAVLMATRTPQPICPQTGTTIPHTDIVIIGIEDYESGIHPIGRPFVLIDCK